MTASGGKEGGQRAAVQESPASNRSREAPLVGMDSLEKEQTGQAGMSTNQRSPWAHSSEMQEARC